MFFIVQSSVPYTAAPLSEANLDLSQFPLSFVPNEGQADPVVKFQVHDMGGTVFFTQDAIVLALPATDQTDSAIVRLRFHGANQTPTIAGAEKLSGLVNYMTGNDSDKWYTDLPTYKSVVYQQLYPGIDLYYDGQHGYLKGTYVVAPGVDPALIRWHHDGVSDVQVDETTGNLLLTVPNAIFNTEQQSTILVEEAPIAWQERNGEFISVPIRYSLAEDGSVGFALGSYDSAYPLTIDPTIRYSTFLGGNKREDVEGVVVDSSGAIYIAGSTESTSFPKQNAYQGSKLGEDDAFVSKINAAGNALVYSTYLGGSDGDQAISIAIDSSNNVYVTGDTRSTDFPTRNALQSKCTPIHPSVSTCMGDAFVTKLNANGNGLVYSTYLGGIHIDRGGGIAVDNSGNAYVVGTTSSEDFPTKNPYQSQKKGDGLDVFVSKLNANGKSLIFSTYLGGNENESGAGIAVTSGGNAYVTGFTNSSNFPTKNAAQSNLSGSGDAFVTKLNKAGDGLEYSTYLGGSNEDQGADIALDNSGKAHITGKTESSNFPTKNAIQNSLGGDFDAFVTRLNSSGNAWDFSTYLGGNRDDEGKGIAVNGAGNAYITGQTASNNFPTKNALQGSKANNDDAFVVKLNSNGKSLNFSTYLGGNSDEYGDSIAVINNGVVVAGVTFSGNFPMHNPLRANNAGNGDAFVAIIDDDGGCGPENTPTPTDTPTPVDPVPTDTPTYTPAPNEPTSTPTPTPVDPVPTDTPTYTPAPNEPTSTPTPTPVDPVPTDTPTYTPAPNEPTSTPTPTPVDPVPTDTPTYTPAPNEPTSTPTPTPVDPVPTDTPTYTPAPNEPTSTSTPTPVDPVPTYTPTYTPIPSEPLPTVTPTTTPTDISLADFNLTASRKRASDLVVDSGDKLVYRIQLQNSGPDGVAVNVRDELPAELNFVEGSITGNGRYEPETRGWFRIRFTLLIHR
ncbi:SBBP repeat-containing protein [Chloroflexi bacterium TSY]|nr:SBBP repeat-containing protein [Chloroflexi bacterium TSY]